MTEKHAAPFIPPTIGRVVHYFERGSDGNVTGPLTALVVHVWSDAVVNLAVFSANGLLAQVTSVSLVQGNDAAGPFSRWCEWMPFQKGQAAKAEAELKPGDFGQALDWLKAGKCVSRAGWNGKGLWLELQRPDAHSKMTLPYLFLNYPADAINTPGARVPWLASQTDMLADDWTVRP